MIATATGSRRRTIGVGSRPSRRPSRSLRLRARRKVKSRFLWVAAPFKLRLEKIETGPGNQDRNQSRKPGPKIEISRSSKQGPQGQSGNQDHYLYLGVGSAASRLLITQSYSTCRACSRGGEADGGVHDPAEFRERGGRRRDPKPDRHRAP